MVQIHSDKQKRWNHHMTLLALSKLKAFSDDKLKVAQIMICAFDGVENIVENGEAAFSPFPRYFQKASLSGSLKLRIV